MSNRGDKMTEWIEEIKGTIEWYTENRDWFYNGWFFGWFDNKSTPDFIEEIKNTIAWTKS